MVLGVFPQVHPSVVSEPMLLLAFIKLGGATYGNTAFAMVSLSNKLGGRLLVGHLREDKARVGASVVSALFGKGQTPQSGSWVETGT